MSDAPEALRRKIIQEVRAPDERISGEEVDLLEKKAGYGGNGERKEKYRSWEGGVTRIAVAGSRGSEAEGDLLLSWWEFFIKVRRRRSKAGQ